MQRIRNEADGVVLVEAGDALTGPQVLPPQRPLRAKLLLAAYDKLGVDAMALGEKDRDPVLGVDLSRTRQRALVTRAGIKVGLFSADLEDPAMGPDPEAAARLRAEAQSLRHEGAQLVVALVHGGIPKARQVLASGAQGVDVAVVSHSGMFVDAPERIGGAWVVEAGSQGKQIGELDLHIIDGKLQFQDTGRRGQLEAQLGTQEKSLIEMSNRRDEATDARLRDYFEHQRQVLADTISVARRQLQTMPAATRGSWIEHKAIPLGTEVADDPTFLAMIKSYKDEVAKLPPTVDPGAQVGPGAVTAVGGYTGAERCRACHAAAFTQWQGTKHARAWASLEKKGQSRDPACIGCHVTGGQVAMHDVQCEACHGPGAAHEATRGQVKTSIARNPPEVLCRTCHTPTQTTEWEFTAFRSAVLGKGHGRH